MTLGKLVVVSFVAVVIVGLAAGCTRGRSDEGGGVMRATLTGDGCRYEGDTTPAEESQPARGNVGRKFASRMGRDLSIRDPRDGAQDVLPCLPPSLKRLAEEAKEQDVRNREKLVAGRTGRFDPYLSGTEKRLTAKRGRTRI